MKEIMDTFSTIPATIRQIQTEGVANHQHLLRLMHFEIGLAIGVLTAQGILVGMSIYTLRLHRKMREALSVMTNSQEKRLTIALARIEILEKCLGLRPIVQEDAPPPPPSVVM